MNRNLIGAAVLASLAIAGCGTLSNVDANGHASEPVFPEVDKTTFKSGSYPNVDNLRQVRDGVTRDQLYDLLGRPHFSEGFRVREWDYLFHFNTPDGVKTCQFKVLFDKDLIGRSFHWAPAECADILKQKPAAQPLKPFSLSGDVGFAFGSAALTAAGLDEVRRIASELNRLPEVDRISVSGHTDRIGDAASNQRLSQQRAESVRRALVAQGIPASIIGAQGLGQERPVVECAPQSRNELIACLAPNRRVDITVQGRH